MKKLLCVLCAALLLTACAPQPYTSLPESPPSTSTPAQAPPAAAPRASGLDMQMLLHNTGGKSSLAVTWDAIYTVVDLDGGLAAVMVTVPATLESHPLCPDEGCAHDTAACQAVFESWAYLYATDGVLLVEHYRHLYALQPDGTLLELLETAETQRLTELVVYGEWLVLGIADYDSPEFYGNFEMKHYMQNLYTGETQPLGFEPTGHLFGAGGDWLVAEDGDYLVCHNLHTGEETLVLPATRFLGVYEGAIFGLVMDEGYWLARCAPETGAYTRLLQLENLFFTVSGAWEGKLFCTKTDQYGFETPLLVDGETGEVRQWRKDAYDFRIYTPLGRCSAGFVVDGHSEEGTHWPALVTPAAFWGGSDEILTLLPLGTR